jgi:hypothetical protein
VTLTLTFDDIAGAVMGLRASVRGVIANPAPPGVPPNPCVGLAGILQARLGYIGLARGLVARLNASRVGLPSRSAEAPPNPCLITLEFRNRDGELLTTRAGGPAQIQAELLAGQTSSLELSSADAVRGNSCRGRESASHHAIAGSSAESLRRCHRHG